MPKTDAPLHFKDKQLEELAKLGNVAQFVSFSPEGNQRFSRITGFAPNHLFSTTQEALATLLVHSPERKINLRSFKPDEPQGQEFIYGIDSADVAEGQLRRLTLAGLFVIANETVDVNDGGVSGVAYGNVLEFAPGSTPRVVETGKIVSLTRDVGERLLDCVYGFVPSLPKEPELRIEFSIHPVRRGFASEHTIVWESQYVPVPSLSPVIRWPNAFSEFLGDKVFGLLLAHALGLQVPRSLVLSRNTAPFAFGGPTGSEVKWLRTAPRVPEPGFYPTVRGWTDPFKLLENTEGSERVASVIVQDEVHADFSGALITDRDGSPIIEGVDGFGDEFMLGRVGPSQLDGSLIGKLEALHELLFRSVGSVRAEWAFDGDAVWIIQLQQEVAISTGRTIVSGEVESEVEFDISGGLSGLRELVALVAGKSVGIKIIGNVGMTSHIADVLRRYKIPSRIATGVNSAAR